VQCHHLGRLLLLTATLFFLSCGFEESVVSDSASEPTPGC